MDMNNLYQMNQAQAQQEQLEAAKRKILGLILTREAFERLGRVRSVNESLASTVEMYLFQLYQAGKLKGQITDEQMKQVLASLAEKKEPKISFKRV